MNSFELFITQLWQIAAVVVLIYAAVRWFASDRPHLAHALWAIVLFKCLVPPLWSSSFSPFTWICTAAQRFSSPDEITVQPIPRLSSDMANDGAGERESQWTPRKAATDGQIHSYVFTPPPSNSSTFTERKWLQVLFWAWIGTVAVASSSMLIRYVCLLVWLARAKSVEDPRSQKCFLQMTQKLQLKRQVQLRILEYPLGPAVLGILRPTVLLPKMIVDRMSDSELEALIAHELVHLRRGDLVWGGLQTIASCLWWFHPGVWFANRMLSHESERSCDEETITLLDCDVKEYAKCLLTVLEHKHRLQVAPVLPGVRPMQITANRLERIMRLPHGCRASRSKWIWGWLILGCCLLLPGAAFVVAQPPSTMPTFVPQPIHPTTEPTSAATAASWSAHSGLRVTPSPIAEDSGPLVLTVYRIGNVLDKLVEHRNKSIYTAGIDPSLINTEKLREQSRTHLITILKAAKNRYDEVSATPQAESMAWEGDNLTVRATEIRHASIRTQLDSIGKYGFHQVLIRVHLLSSTSELDIEGLSWTTPFTMLNNDQTEALISFGNTDRRARMLYEPSLVVNNGESGVLESLNERPAAPRLDTRGNSTAETLSAGVRVRVEPLLMEGGKVRLSYESEYSKFVPMESPPGSNLPPRRRMVSFSTMVDVPPGKAFACRTRMANSADSKIGECLLWVVQCTLIDASDEKRVADEIKDGASSQRTVPVIHATKVFESQAAAKFKIRGDADGMVDPTNAISKQHLVAALERLGVIAEFEGTFAVKNFEFQRLSGETLTAVPVPRDLSFEIQGKNLQLEYSREDSTQSLRCAHGRIRWSKNRKPHRIYDFSLGADVVEMDGSITMRAEDMKVHVERVVMGSEGRGIAEKVKFESDQGTGTADQAQFQDEQIELKGNVTILSKQPNGTSTLFEGNRLRFVTKK